MDTEPGTCSSRILSIVRVFFLSEGDAGQVSSTLVWALNSHSALFSDPVQGESQEEVINSQRVGVLHSWEGKWAIRGSSGSNGVKTGFPPPRWAYGWLIQALGKWEREWPLW